jgi:hypothetical protein
MTSVDAAPFSGPDHALRRLVARAGRPAVRGSMAAPGPAEMVLGWETPDLSAATGPSAAPPPAAIPRAGPAGPAVPIAAGLVRATPAAAARTTPGPVRATSVPAAPTTTASVASSMAFRLPRGRLSRAYPPIRPTAAVETLVASAPPTDAPLAPTPPPSAAPLERTEIPGGPIAAWEMPIEVQNLGRVAAPAGAGLPVKSDEPTTASPPSRPHSGPAPPVVAPPWTEPRPAASTALATSTPPDVLPAAHPTVVIERIEVVTPPAGQAPADPFASLSARRTGASRHGTGAA